MKLIDTHKNYIKIFRHGDKAGENDQNFTDTIYNGLFQAAKNRNLDDNIANRIANWGVSQASIESGEGKQFQADYQPWGMGHPKLINWNQSCDFYLNQLKKNHKRFYNYITTAPNFNVSQGVTLQRDSNYFDNSRYNLYKSRMNNYYNKYSSKYKPQVQPQKPQFQDIPMPAITEQPDATKVNYSYERGGLFKR